MVSQFLLFLGDFGRMFWRPRLLSSGLDSGRRGPRGGVGGVIDHGGLDVRETCGALHASEKGGDEDGIECIVS